MNKRKKLSFYPDDWLGGTMTMTPAERGVYIDLLCAQWSVGPMTEEQALSAGRANPDLIREVLRKKFHQNPNGTYQNNRMEQERKAAGKDKPQKASRMPQESTNVLPGMESGFKQETPQAVKLRPVMVFACRGEPGLWSLEVAQYERWQQIYDGLDIDTELAKASAWLEANGAKTHKGMPRFLVTWFNRACDRGRGGSWKADKPQPESFRAQDDRRRKQMILKLSLEQMGLTPDDAERLSKLPQPQAEAEARKILYRETQTLKIEEIPW